MNDELWASNQDLQRSVEAITANRNMWREIAMNEHAGWCNLKHDCEQYVLNYWEALQND